MTDNAMSAEDFEDNRVIQFTQVKREYIVNTLMDPTNSNKGIPKNEGDRIVLMQALDGLSSVAMKRQSMRQKAKADQDGSDALKQIAAQVIMGMVGRNAGGKRTAPVVLKQEHKQTYVEGELSTEQTVVDESQIMNKDN